MNYKAEERKEYGLLWALSSSCWVCLSSRESIQWVGGTLCADNFITELSAIDRGGGGKDPSAQQSPLLVKITFCKYITSYCETVSNVYEKLCENMGNAYGKYNVECTL